MIDRLANVVREVNGKISSREEFYMRGAAAPRPGIQVLPQQTPQQQQNNQRPTPVPNGVTFNGTTSLSIGQWVKGCVPILVEMGQQNQPVSRRVDLHLIVARSTMELHGIV